MTFGSRLRELRKENKLTQEQLGKLINVSKATISMYEKNDRQPSKQTIIRFAQRFNVTTDYLLGNSSNDSSAKIPNITATKDSELINANHPIPVYGSIHAGSPGFAEQNIIGTTMATDRIIREFGSDNLFALQINGDSMNKIVPNGHTAVFVKNAAIENGDIVAVLIDHEEATIKRFKETSLAVMFEPESYYDSYKPIVFPKTGEQNFKILGKYLYESSLPI